MAVRRGALVPPKMDMEEEEDMEGLGGGGSAGGGMDIVIEDTDGGGGGGSESVIRSGHQLNPILLGFLHPRISVKKCVLFNKCTIKI